MTHSSTRKNHEPQFGKKPIFKDVGIFYNFVFDLGETVNPTEASRKLLDEDFALSAPNYLTDDIEVATRFKELFKLRQQAEQLSELSLCLKNCGAKGFTKWAFKHPKQSLTLLSVFRKAQNGKKIEKKQETNDKEINDSLKRDAYSIAQDTINYTDEAMSRIGLLEALQKYSDRTLFSPTYLREIPFVRVGLQPFYACIDGENLSIDVGLLIHRTGVAVLTFYALYSKEKTTEELIELSKANNAKITSSKVVRSIVEPQACSVGLTPSKLDKAPFERDFSSGVEWFIYEKLEDANLLEVFLLYQAAVISTILGKKPKKLSEPFSWLRCPDWFAYPIIFIRQTSPECPTDQDFKEEYPNALAGIILRFNKWGELKAEKVNEAIANDFSLTHDHSLFLESSHTIVLYHGSYKTKLEEQFGKDIPGQKWLFHHFQTSAILDVLLIQRWILHIYNCELSKISYNLNKLNSIKRNLILALEEYYNITVSYGTAQEIINVGRKKMGIDNLYDGIKNKLSNFEKLIEVEESSMRYRRNMFFKTIGLLITLLFGLPGANQVVNVISSWNELPLTDDSGFFVYSYNYLLIFVKVHPIFTTLSLCGILFCLVVSIMIWSLQPTRKRNAIISFDQSGSADTGSFTWPTKIYFEPHPQTKTENSNKNTISKEKMKK